MSQPLGFVDSDKPRYVCKLQTQYEFKQVPKIWFKKLSTCLYQWGFETSNAYTSMIIFKQGNDTMIFLIYIDDLLVTGRNYVLIQKMITELHQLFELKDLGTFSFFLGTEM